MEKEKIKSQIEALLFVKEFKIKELKKKFNIKEEEIKKLIEEINKDLKNRPYYIEIDNENVYFTIKEKYKELVKDYLKPSLEKEKIEILTMIVNNFSYSEIAKSKKRKKLLEELEKEGWIKIKKENNKYKFILTQKFKQYFKVK
ncbi:MAG: SMC-Scp complex subunit ScpB [Nanoarchaeota archaeon]